MVVFYFIFYTPFAEKKGFLSVSNCCVYDQVWPWTYILLKWQTFKTLVAAGSIPSSSK